MSKPRGSILWPGAIFALLAMNVAIVAITVTLALSDRPPQPTFDSGHESSAWDSDVQKRINASLGWKATIRVERDAGGPRVLRLSLVDSSDRPIRSAQVQAEIFRENEPDSRMTIGLSADGSGGFTAAWPVGPDGRRRVRARIDALASVFTAEESIDLPHAPSPTR